MRVAAFQRAPISDDPRAVSAGIAQDVAWAASEGVGLAIFPEAYLDGHSYDRETVSARARALHDPEVQQLARSLRRFPVTSVVGMFERRVNAVRNVALVLRAGEIIGVYAKARPNENGVQAGSAASATSSPVLARRDCWASSSDVTGRCGDRISLGCTAMISPGGEIRARVPEGTTGGIVLDLEDTGAVVAIRS